MPTYQYRCTHCKNTLEVFQNMSDDPHTECPACKRHGLKRVISGGTGIIFKGKGFYVTDSQRAPKTDATSTKGEEAPKPQTQPADKPTSATKSKPAQDSKSNA